MLDQQTKEQLKQKFMQIKPQLKQAFPDVEEQELSKGQSDPDKLISTLEQQIKQLVDSAR